ncbi:PREDICTED: lck-interacting transmembrane adapter 1 isoform X4 [Dipodomys ordii]|uniref:Lck-interacting transmembrane adapter 1 isoform X4 n=1 Tax=Dipodomys ordii TaxID=10020 RepID=A0A1S3GCU2_DIPOR|nr:PREDICTED: lck-interacting transmembrane adapter 1 isoform X4 [Dipodomys ordii]
MRGLQASPDGHAWTRSALAAACALRGFPVQPWPCFWPLLWPYSSAKGPSNAFLHQEPWLEEGRWARARGLGLLGVCLVPRVPLSPALRCSHDRMGLLAPPAPPVLWVLGCLSLLLWLWALCTACHRKQAQRGPARRPVVMMPVGTQVRHEAAGTPPWQTPQHSPTTCQHGSASTVARDVQGQHQTAGRRLSLPTAAAAQDPFCYHSRHLHRP